MEKKVKESIREAHFIEDLTDGQLLDKCAVVNYCRRRWQGVGRRYDDDSNTVVDDHTVSDEDKKHLEKYLEQYLHDLLRVGHGDDMRDVAIGCAYGCIMEITSAIDRYLKKYSDSGIVVSFIEKIRDDLNKRYEKLEGEDTFLKNILNKLEDAFMDAEPKTNDYAYNMQTGITDTCRDIQVYLEKKHGVAWCKKNLGVKGSIIKEIEELEKSKMLEKKKNEKHDDR